MNASRRFPSWRKQGAPSNTPLLQVLALALLVFVTTYASPQTYTVLYRFKGANDGAFPFSRLVLDGAGNLYGTAFKRGAYNFGTIFKLDPGGKFSLLHTFTGLDGLWPYGDLFLDKKGNLFGTTSDGGVHEGGNCRHGCGTLFKLEPSGKYHILHVFNGDSGGGEPSGKLIRDQDGSFYGVTYLGGARPCGYLQAGCGVIFKIDHTGNETVLYTFGAPADGGSASDLIRDASGNIYGTTGRGGNFGWGSVFKLDPFGTWNTLYSFTGGTDGNEPGWGGVIRDGAGNLFGTTQFGGDPTCEAYLNGCGVLFQVDPVGTETVLYTFTGDESQGDPFGPLIRDSGGNLYGTGFPIVGACQPHCGTIFKIDRSGTKTILHEFDSPEDGVGLGQIIMDNAGNIYGTTEEGGNVNNCFYGCGVIFKITP